MAKLQLVQDPAADALLVDPFALLVGMLLDQQVPMETAFAWIERKIADRIGGVDAREIVDYDPEKFAALCSERPASTPVSGIDGKAGPDAGADHRRPLRR